MDQEILTMLELIRLEGIVKMLWETIDHAELADTVHVICQNENENIRSELDRMARQQLIEIATDRAQRRTDPVLLRIGPSPETPSAPEEAT